MRTQVKKETVETVVTCDECGCKCSPKTERVKQCNVCDSDFCQKCALNNVLDLHQLSPVCVACFETGDFVGEIKEERSRHEAAMSRLQARWKSAALAAKQARASGSTAKEAD